MEPWLYELSWMMASLLLGVGLGSLTGLIPGFHVNNVALILLSVSPALLSLGIPLSAVAGLIISTKQVLNLKSNFKAFGIVFLSFFIIAFLSISFVMSKMSALPINSI